MPIRVTDASGGGQTYGHPFLGPVDHTVGIEIDLTLLTNHEIDAHGYLKPGVPFTKTGVLVGADPAYVYGVTLEPIKVLKDNASATIAAAPTVTIAVGVVGSVIAAVCVSNLGRALTSNELAGFVRVGAKLVLI